MTQRQLHQQSPPQRGWTAHKAGYLKHTAQPAGSSPAWRVSFAGDSVDLSLFQVSQLISASFRLLDLSPYSLQLGSAKNHSPQSFLFLSLGGRSLLNLVNFRDFLKLFLALYFLS